MTVGRKPSGFYLDMPFEEALERYAGVPPAEFEAVEGRSSGKKPPRAKKKRTPGEEKKSEKIISLKDRKISKRRRGHS